MARESVCTLGPQITSSPFQNASRCYHLSVKVTVSPHVRAIFYRDQVNITSNCSYALMNGRSILLVLFRLLMKNVRPIGMATHTITAAPINIFLKYLGSKILIAINCSYQKVISTLWFLRFRLRVRSSKK